ncbi:hypothetical protein HDU86_006780 [Geranomyces michiganensis]|nr:hypothetical protein HDU86_006780 [Geranomyces michiganensis]
MFTSVDNLALDEGESTVNRVHELLADSTLSLEDLLSAVVATIIAAVPSIKSRNIFRVVCEQAITGRLDDEALRVADLLSAHDLKDPDTAYVVYSLLLQLSEKCPNAVRRLDSHEWLAHLAHALIAQPVPGRTEQIASQLLCKVCDNRELSLSELEIFQHDFLASLCALIEQTRDTVLDEKYSYIRAVVAIHDQFAQKFAARAVVVNPVLQILEERLDNSKTFTENFVLLFNRAEDRGLRVKMVEFLDNVLANPSTRNLFYTNDLGVILDVALRETNNVDADDEMLHQKYIFLLPLLINLPGSSWPAQRRRDVEKLLVEIRDGPFVRPNTRHAAGRALMGRTRKNSE